MKITLIIYSLSSGGAERVLSTMANYWAQKGWSVTLITFDNGKVTPFYELDSKVNHQPINIASTSSNVFQALWNNFNRIWILRTAIKKNGLSPVISFMDRTNVLTLLATIGLKQPVIVAERIDPRLQSPGLSWHIARTWIYPRATHIVMQTQAACSFFSSSLKQRISVIPNPLYLPKDGPSYDSVHKHQHKILIAMGRLTEQKGFDLLIKAFALISHKHPNWKLDIWGDGPLRTELQAQIDKLQLGDCVRLRGKTKEPWQQMQQADLFILSSRWEGFPNVLIEAMACGLPVISFDCLSGPQEIICHGKNGLLVPVGDVNALGIAINELLEDEKKRHSLALAATEVKKHFNTEKIMSMWEALLQ